ncbi:AAA family ATPase [Sanguibacter inulinus]|uniref:Nuclease SbcCD subunit C n=1 Tax=Sanguibacter inulinus TaxID=60922 RepID=A0A853ET52_9MICO|nr:AAA family ATPase [Sanguibacter inulinus]MBF0720943.1 AAA family ATPase [Sanguibacter inulinus]NYS92088.1 AAA family ATPase [Sanguibacter inulinus]
MQLHSMTLQAVGPFAGRHTVDFSALAASGIFLLEGPTGAGKSTLIDAVVFALYGKVASASTSDDRLRSAYADDATDSFVDLTFETAAGVLRVLRTPERQRAKKRGEGTTKQQATVKLWRLPSDAVTSGAGLGEPGDVGELTSTRLDEVGLEIQRAVGLDRAQFVQTIVLPQGEFASFLRSKPEDRKGLLQKVFGTEVYDRAEAALVTMRKTADQQLKAAQGGVQVSLETFLATSALDPEDAETLRAARPEHLGKLAAEHAHELAETAKHLEVDAAAAREVLGGRRQTLDVGRATLDAVARRDALRVESARLAEAADEVRGLADRLDAARRASVVLPTVEAEVAARDGLTRAAAGLAAAVEAQGPVVGDLSSIDALARLDWTDRSAAHPDDEVLAARAAVETAVASLVERRTADTAQVVLLDRVARLEAGLPARRARLEEATVALDVTRGELVAAADALAERPAARSALEAERDAARALAAQVDALREQERRAATTTETIARLGTLRTELGQAESAMTVAADRAQEAADHERELRRRWIDGIAGEIAGDLRPGEPCPVCGGHEHPAPATVGEDHVGKERVEQAEAARQEAERELTARHASVTGVAERVAAHEALLDGVDTAAAVTELEAVRTRLREAEAAGTAVQTAERAVVDFDAETLAAESRRSRLAEQVAADEARLEHDGAAITADEAEVETARAAHRDVVTEAPEVVDAAGDAGQPTAVTTISEIVAVLEHRVSAITSVLEVCASHAAAVQSLAERETERVRALDEHDFPTVQAVREAWLDRRELAAVEALVSEHRSAQDRVAAGLAEPSLVALPETVEVDLDALRAAVTEAEALAHEATTRAAVVVQRAADMERGARHVTDAVVALDTVRDSTEPVIRMANLATGASSDNARSLTLTTFVLMRRFEDVVAAANDRLATMSDGRYELVRSDDREDVSTRKTGLAMRVLDHSTETARDPRTLSGGETFYVSLCLALGMADVVTAEAGGIDLGTLFVDEGFGSLDPETLDSVLGVLGGLRAGGRVVGVVSHVEALKQTIADGISVRRLPDGSSTLTVRAG